MARLVYIRSNYPTSEPRSQNILRALNRFKPAVVVWNRKMEKTINLDWYTLNLRAPFGPSSLLQMPIWWLFIFKSLVKLRPRVIHVCNFDSCLPTYFYSLLTGAKYVYDMWDTAGGMFGGTNRPLIRLLNVIERGMVKRSEVSFLPDKVRLEQLGYVENDDRSHKIKILPNSQAFKQWGSNRVKWGKKPLRLLYTGVLARKIRGLEMMVEAVGAVDGVELTIGGYGSDESYLKDLLKSSPNSQRVRMLDKVRVSELSNLYRQTDFIVTLLDPEFPNYQYATSTKAYEAFANGLPIITTEGTATGNLVTEKNWGFVVPFNRGSLVELFRKLTTEPGELLLEESTVKDLDWRESETYLQQLYADLLKN